MTILRLTSALGATLMLCSCTGNADFARKRDATIACWKSFIEMGKTSAAELDNSPKGKQVARVYREAGLKIAAFPTLDVDPEVVEIFGRFSRDFAALSVIFERISSRHEDISYGLEKIAESFLRGLTGDPFGVTREELVAIRKDNAELEVVQGRLRKNLDDLRQLRPKLTARYKIEFAPVQ